MLARILVPTSVLLLPLSFVFACGDSDPVAPAAELPDAASDAPVVVPDATNDVTPVPVPTVEVHGKLLDQLDRPIAGYKVATALTTTPVTTAADGTFTVKAPTPYDLVITTTTGDNVFVVAGLTRVDPIVPLPTSIADDVYAKFTGTMPAVTTGQGAQVIFAPTDGKSAYSDYNLEFGPADTYERTPGWQAAAPFAGTLYLFQYSSGPTNTAATFLGWSKLENLTIGKDETQTANFPALTSLTTNNISGVMTVPANWTKGGSFFAFMRLKDTKARLTINQSLSSDLSFSMPVPEVDQATYGIAFRALGTTQGEQSVVRKVIGLGATANVTMPAAAVVTAPANDATGIDATSAFTWTKTDGISYLSAYPKEGDLSASTPGLHVITASGSTKLPDLAALGATLAAGKAYRWQIVTYPLVASVDAFTTGGNVDWFCTPYSPIGADEAICTFSASRTFVTK